jgi:hypothetical protein
MSIQKYNRNTFYYYYHHFRVFNWKVRVPLPPPFWFQHYIYIYLSTTHVTNKQTKRRCFYTIHIYIYLYHYLCNIAIIYTTFVYFFLFWCNYEKKMQQWRQKAKQTKKLTKEVKIKEGICESKLIQFYICKTHSSLHNKKVSPSKYSYLSTKRKKVNK